VVTLESSTLFGQLPQAELDLLAQLTHEKTLEPGSQIFKEGDPGDGLYFIKDGLVEISVNVGPNAEHVISQVGPGDILGEMAVLEDKPRSATATALQKTSLLFIPRGELLGLVSRSPALSMALLREISSRLREFNGQYLREVIQAERLAVVGRFARSIIHDLKNPLNIIGITAEIAGMDNSTPEARRENSTRITRQVERISEMIGEILEFTQGAGSQFILTSVDFPEFLSQILSELHPELSPKSVTIEMPVPPPPVSLLLNPKRLRRAFSNLIHNAAEAMPNGGSIYLRFETKPSEIVVEVEDTGPGIATEIADRLFEPFATFGKTHGTGLGLSICKRIIEEHHGWIRARSEPGRGAIFTFGLPLPKKPE
jgi:signal transduction histidine kinase